MPLCMSCWHTYCMVAGPCHPKAGPSLWGAAQTESATLKGVSSGFLTHYGHPSSLRAV